MYYITFHSDACYLSCDEGDLRVRGADHIVWIGIRPPTREEYIYMKNRLVSVDENSRKEALRRLESSVREVWPELFI
jgi:diphthamide synthase subunit DPH2